MAKQTASPSNPGKFGFMLMKSFGGKSIKKDGRVVGGRGSCEKPRKEMKSKVD